MANGLQKMSAFHKGVGHESRRLLTIYRDRGLVDCPSGVCSDCGQYDARFSDHRDYSEALTVDFVCGSCNKLRGAAVIPFFNVDSGCWIKYREKLRWKKAA